MNRAAAAGVLAGQLTIACSSTESLVEVTSSVDRSGILSSVAVEKRGKRVYMLLGMVSKGDGACTCWFLPVSDGSEAACCSVKHAIRWKSSLTTLLDARFRCGNLVPVDDTAFEEDEDEDEEVAEGPSGVAVVTAARLTVRLEDETELSSSSDTLSDILDNSNTAFSLLRRK